MRPAVTSPSRAVFIACTTLLSLAVLAPPAPVAGFSVSFVYNDLLAHPQYHVQYLDELVPMSAIGADRLQMGNRHRQPRVKAAPQIEPSKDEIHDQNHRDTLLDKGDNSQDHGNSPSGSNSRAARHTSSMIMTDADSQRWACVIPSAQVQEVEPMQDRTPQEIEEEERRSVKRGLELLEHLTGRCLKTNYGYWTYEYCHKKIIRQFHAADNIKWEPVSEDLTNVLGVYQPPPAGIQGQPNIDALAQHRTPASSTGRIPTSTELGVSNERKYLVQQWKYGKVCEETGALRTIEVQFQCANTDDRIQLVREPALCHYVMVIYSSSLCKDVAFELIPAPEANKIDCRRVVSDEQYQQRQATGAGTIEGGIGSPLFQNSMKQSVFGQQPDKAYAARSKMFSEINEVEALIRQVEAATKNKQLGEILAEIEDYFEELNPSMTEEQMDMLQKLKDFADGKTNSLESLAYDKNGQPLELNALLEALFGTASLSDDHAVEQQKEAELNNDNREVFQMMLEAWEDYEKRTSQDTSAKDLRESDIDLAQLLALLDGTKKEGAASGVAEGDSAQDEGWDKNKGKNKDRNDA
ncbi:Protein OS-9 [Dissophora globulifera]|uniref:Protein OS-9 homolog n=1 Tax=Dissophora globulifera TaxID=979702 RepID=A0A9P6R283_9FUNG|nr:Protein OS-9 [Dissophora globulifera]